MFNFSSFFGGVNNTNSYGFGSMGSFDFGEYRMIKSGSYKKLLKAYYAEQKSSTSAGSKTSSSARSSKSIMDKLDEERKQRIQKAQDQQKDTSGLSKMKVQADCLKTAAEAFGTQDVFQKDGSYDADKAVKAINQFVNRYNATLDQAGKVSAKEITQQTGYMQSMSNTMSKELEKIGIKISEDGKLSVDEDTLKKAAQEDVEALFSGTGSYAGEIANKALDIERAVMMNSNFNPGSGSYYSASV